jgi:hypothetical protein
VSHVIGSVHPILREGHYLLKGFVFCLLMCTLSLSRYHAP